MTLPSIWQACKFSDEIVSGVPDYSKFAVELHSVLDKSADRIYQDPSQFLGNTYLTLRMEVFLKDVLRKVERNVGQPVYVIDTEFGGGKTHTLLLIYHVLKSGDVGSDYIKKYGFESKYDLSDVPSARVVAIDCRQLHKNTLWGEIAETLGMYDSVKVMDQEKRPINDIGIIKAFFKEPTVLLIDELPIHLLQADAERIGNTTLAEMTVTFLQNLISAVSAVKNSVLVITLTAEQQLYRKYAAKVRLGIKQITDYKVDQLVGDMKEAMSRQVQFVIPVDNKEVYHVVVTRLVKEINASKRKQVVDEFITYYEQKGMLPHETDYRKKFEASYPFHPFLIDTLYGRVSSIPQFNKTRGLLRLLALVLHNIYANKEECSVVNLSNVEVSDSEISDELTIKLDRGYLKQAIEVDCIAKAKAMDERRILKVVEKTSRSILMYSLIGAAKMSGIRPADLKLAVCEPGMDATLIDKVLEDIEDEFWYIVIESGEYYFGQDPNVNKMIQEYMREVKDAEARVRIRDVLEDLLVPTSEVSVAIWEHENLEDSEKLKIFAIDYKEDLDDDAAKERLGYLLERNPNGSIRTFQNTMAFLYPEKAGVDTLIKHAREVCAIEKTVKDERVKLDKGKMSKLNSKLSAALGQLVEECMAVYSKMAYPNGPVIRADSLSSPELKEDNLTFAVLARLRSLGKLLDKLSSDVIADIVKARQVISVTEVYQLFKKDRGQRFITTGSVIMNAAAQAVKEGKVGYATELVEKDGKYEGTTGREVSIAWNGHLIESSRLFVAQVEGEDGKGPEILSPPPSALQKYSYKFNLLSMDEMVKTLQKVPVVMVGGNKETTLTARLENESDVISIESKLKNTAEMISLLRQLSGRFKGNGTLYIRSKDDIHVELAKMGLEVTS